MKRKLIITVICLFIVVFVLICYCYIKQQNEEYERDLLLFPPVVIGLVDSTQIYSMDELMGRLLPLSDENLKRFRGLNMAFSGHHPYGAKGYDTFPPIVSELIYLEYLDFSWNEISDLTPIQNLQHLKTIILKKNKVSSFNGFKNFSDLKYIDIRGNQLSNLKGIEALQNLQSLNLLWNNNLSDLKGIEKLTKLEDLAIGNNNLDSFPTEILQLKNLKRLSMDDLYFKSLPDSFYTVGLPIEILHMKNMHSFDYSANLSQLHTLKKLRELYLSWNNIPVLDIDFEKCENLEVFTYILNIVITDARYYTERPPMGHYWKYIKIDLTDVLKRISKAPKLKNLDLSNNNIRYLPKDIVLPDSLEVLNLSSNYIKQLPVKITKYTNLKKVNLGNNPIDTMLIKKIEKEMVNTKFYYDK